MKVLKRSSLFSQLTVLALTIALLSGQTAMVFAAGTSAAVAGEITVTGTASPGEKPFVLVNGDTAVTGRTFLSNGTISTTDATSAVIDFGKVGRINLSPASSLTLNVSAAGISGTLSAGTVRVSSGAGVAINIATPNETVTNDASLASVLTITVAPEATNVLAEMGVARFNDGRTVAGQAQDDDDDDDGNLWVPVIVIGGAIGGYLIYEATRDEEEVVFSPVR